MHVESERVTRLRILQFFSSFKFVVIIGHLLWFLSSLDPFTSFAVFYFYNSYMVLGKKKK